MRVSNLLVTVLVLGLASCSFRKNPDQDADSQPADVIKTIQQEQEKQAFEGKLTEKNVSVEFAELEEPNTYKMVVRWPKQIKRLQIEINNQKPIIKSILDAADFYETPVFANSTQTVTLLALDTIGGAPISSITLTKTAPKDIVISRQEHLNSDTSWAANRIFFLANGQIITNGHNLNLEANKIYIQKSRADIERSDFYSRQINSQIITTVPGTVAPMESQLRGSFVSVKANFAQGHLAILMVGFNGKDGISGLEKEKAHGLSKSSSLLHGTKGEDGEPGGSTGSVSVLIQDHTQFALEIIQKPGAPGKGGLGATGGSGGMGGPAGANPGAPCVPARNGQNGPTGSSGKDGQDGAPGKVGERITNVNRLTTVELK